MLLQRGNPQRPDADPRATDTIVLDTPVDSPLPGLARQSNSQQPQQVNTPGHSPQQQPDIQPQAASSQTGNQPRPLPRFGPDYRAPSGFSPFRATSLSARHDSRGAHSSRPSFWSPSQLTSGLASRGMGTGERSLSAHPNSKLLDKLMEELSMHQPYDPLAPLPADSTTQQSSVSTTDAVDVDVDAVIARYALKLAVAKPMPTDIVCRAAVVWQCLVSPPCAFCLVFRLTGKSVQPVAPKRQLRCTCTPDKQSGLHRWPCPMPSRVFTLSQLYWLKDSTSTACSQVSIAHIE